MAIIPYLAMTAAEYAQASVLPEKLAWMACHFSPYGTGLSNLPSELPDNAVLIVNDVTPMHRHDSNRIKEQLLQCTARLPIHAVLLDFQRPAGDCISNLIAGLLEALPCPVAVSELYASDFSCPVFLPPCPPYTLLQDHIASWQGREIWLETAASQSKILLTEKGCTYTEISPAENHEAGFEAPELHCHYQIETGEGYAKFTLWRTKEDLTELLKMAAELGIKETIGLYQELG